MKKFAALTAAALLALGMVAATPAAVVQPTAILGKA